MPYTETTLLTSPTFWYSGSIKNNDSLIAPSSSCGVFVKQPGVISIVAECWGAGGSGQQMSTFNGVGGGGGGYARATLTYSPPQESILYVVGSTASYAFTYDQARAGDTGFDRSNPNTPFFKTYAHGGGQFIGLPNTPSVSPRGGGGGVVGDILYTGGSSNRTGGGGGAGSTGNGNNAVSVLGGWNGGAAKSEYGGAGGSNLDGVSAPSGQLYGGGGAGFDGAGSEPGGAGAQGLIRVTATYLIDPAQISSVSSMIEWNGNYLFIKYPLDNRVAYSAAYNGSQFVQVQSGTEYAWIQNTNYIFEGNVRWIPTTSTEYQTGWDGVTGWRAFLEWARQKNAFRFYPTIGDYSVYYDNVYLVEPLNGNHSLETDGTRNVRLVIRSKTTPFNAY